MDYGRIIVHSFEITWKYRALWLFGILFALAGGGGGSNVNYSFGRSDVRGLPGVTLPRMPEFDQRTILEIAAIATCVFLILFALLTILRIISRGALIGLVHELERREIEPRFRPGWDLGTERFVPLLGIALLVNIPLGLISVGLVIMAALPMLGSVMPWISSGGGRIPDQARGIFLTGFFASFGLLCCVGLLLFVLYLAIRPIYEFAVRACVISGMGVVASLGEGYRKVRANVGNVAILYFLIIALGIAFGLLMIPVTLLLIGVPAVLGISALVVTNSLAPAIVVGVILGIPVIILLIVIAGFYQAFENNIWTEGFLALEGQAPAAVPTAPLGPSAPQPAQG